MTDPPVDPCILNSWHVVAVVKEMVPDLARRTRLLGTHLAVERAASGAPSAWLENDAPFAKTAGRLPVIERYGYIWTSLGTPPPDIFPLPELSEPDRRNMNAASVGVNVSAPRVVENFLDLGHLPFVHAGILGAEPHTEVREYDVEVSAERDEILVTRCVLYQPKSAPGAVGGADIEYIFRVPHPYCSVLYKSSAGDPRRMDIIGIFVQPFDEEHVCAHLLVSRVDRQSTETSIRAFQHTIFGQDKPIIENQVPKRLPLNPRAEMPVRSDASSIAYRRWLREKGVTYGTIP
jgi:phenylpropionate dioxygenase-like ring-hydroxylating dioxygenase large terminal subunit